MEKFISTKEASVKLGISERRVQALCEQGRIPDVQMVSGIWIIPENVIKPKDERLSKMIDDSTMYSLSQVCEILSISVATGKNWIKLGKLIPSKLIKKSYYFYKDYIDKLKNDIKTGKNGALKSRRNKKFVSGKGVYNSYVSEYSSNVANVQKLLTEIPDNEILSDIVLSSIIAEASIQLIVKRKKISTKRNHNLLLMYIQGELCLCGYEFLIEDLLNNKNLIENYIIEHQQLFSIEFTYEENEDILGLIYISSKNIGKRKAIGAYYTPTNVVKKLVSKVFDSKIWDSTCMVCDPCCGTGNFLLQLPPKVQLTQIYGNDLDSIGAKITRINLALKFNCCDKDLLYSHITEHNYLFETTNLIFDAIIGNPPWGYEFTNEEKEELKNHYKSAVGKNIESYDVFIERALSYLKVNGILSFVLPEAILNVKTHNPIRQIILDKNSIQYLEFLGNAFDKVQCPCIILQMIHTNKMFSSKGISVNDGKKSFKIETERVINYENFNFNISDEDYLIIQKIEGIKDKTFLANKSIFALGIVTGNNQDYISNTKSNENEIVLKGSELYKYKYKTTNNYIKFIPKSFQQVAPTEYYRAPEKLLYRFICNQLVFSYDDKQTLSLNSANILIPKIKNLKIKYVMAILNSRIAQFYFKKQFNSVKVLRSHIEQIPIPIIQTKDQERIITIVNSLITTDNKTIELYNKLDKYICDIFGLSVAEYQYIIESMKNDNLFLE